MCAHALRDTNDTNSKYCSLLLTMLCHTSCIIFKIVFNLLLLYAYAIGPAFLFLYMTDKLSFWLMHGLAGLQLAWMLVIGLVLMALVDFLESGTRIVDQNQNVRGVLPALNGGRTTRYEPDTCPPIDPSATAAAAALISAINANRPTPTISNQRFHRPIGGTETPPPSYAEAISTSNPLVGRERRRRKEESECEREPSP